MKEAWFSAQFEQYPPPPYCSVDLRNSGYKIAPVDTNLFSAGFNNLHLQNIPKAIAAAEKLAKDTVENCRNIVIIPENHTRNIFYFESLASLQEIFTKAGFNVKIGSLLEEITRPHEVLLPSGKKIILEPIQRKNNQLLMNGFCPCLILLNHDLSGGVPEILQNLEQKIVPPLALGWWSRKKSDHFRFYQQVAAEYAKAFQIDPWLIQAEFDTANHINFETGEGEEILLNKAYNLLEKIEKKYKEYKIQDSPYLVIKADSGTYGMGVLTVKNIEEIKNLNRKERSRMMATKGNQKIDQVIIQEGVYTIETRGEERFSAEPVIYMIESEIIGGFYRVNKNKKSDENLNSPGMVFEPVDIFSCFTFENYRTVARLALLAAAKELQ